mmetsp:Transcript_27628/g.40807  ORF Transcript_27628/g.40807 Transcript_27628/m.40807 type:complete len:458 (+) Transcript_27628:151-1524(+)
MSQSSRRKLRCQAAEAFDIMLENDKMGDACIVEKCYVVIGAKLEVQGLLFCALQQIIDLERDDNALKLRFTHCEKQGNVSGSTANSNLRLRPVLDVENCEKETSKITSFSECRHAILLELQTKLRLPPDFVRAPCLRSDLERGSTKQKQFELDLPILRFPIITLPLPLPQMTSEFGFATLIRRIKLFALFRLLKLLLLERSVLVIGDKLEEVTACTCALPELLNPFEWASVFMPILPLDMLDFLSSPVPYIAGVVSSHKEGVSVVETDYRVVDAVMNGLSILNLTTGKLQITTEEGTDYMMNQCSNPISHDLIHYQAKFLDLMKNRSSALHSFREFFQRGASPRESSVLYFLKRVIARHLSSLTGALSERPDGWKQFGEFDQTTNEFAFFPSKFIKPLQAQLKYQEMLAHTQLFVGFVEKKKGLFMERSALLKGQEALFIANWVYFRWWKKRFIWGS